MSYRELTMIDVREVLRRWAAGQGDRQIGRDTGTDRKTVARYREIAEQLGVPRDRALADDEVHEVAQRVQARVLRDPSAEWEEVAGHKERIEDWLGRKRPLRLKKIHVLLKRDHGLGASYDTLRRYAIQEFGWRKKALTVRLEDPPAGQEAQVDFGRMGHLLDEATGRIRVLWALIVTLSFSRYQFAWPTFRQTTEAICEGLDRAWWFFGAMAKGILPDNTPGIVKDPDALNPILVPSFLDYVQARDIFVRKDSTLFMEPFSAKTIRIPSCNIASLHVQDRIGGALEGLTWGMFCGGMATRLVYSATVNASNLDIAIGSAAGLLIGAMWGLDRTVVFPDSLVTSPAP